MDEQEMNAILECLNKNVDRFIEMQNRTIKEIDERKKNRFSLEQMKVEWTVSV